MGRFHVHSTGIRCSDLYPPKTNSPQLWAGKHFMAIFSQENNIGSFSRVSYTLLLFCACVVTLFDLWCYVMYLGCFFNGIRLWWRLDVFNRRSEMNECLTACRKMFRKIRAHFEMECFSKDFTSNEEWAMIEVMWWPRGSRWDWNMYARCRSFPTLITLCRNVT